MARIEFGQILAALGYRLSRRWRYDTHGDAFTAGRDSLCLRDDAGAVGLPGPDGDGAWSAREQAAVDRGECEAILARLLGSFCPAEAADKARELIDAFGSLAGVFAADQAAHQRVLGTASTVPGFLETARAAFLHSLKVELISGPILSDSRALRDYLFASMAHSAVEELRVLFLNSRNFLIRDQVLFRGTVSSAPVYPREIVRRAIELNATALIIVHNHPSGDPWPSEDDVLMTRQIASAARTVDIILHDHIIMARSGCTSLRAIGMM